MIRELLSVRLDALHSMLRLLYISIMHTRGTLLVFWSLKHIPIEFKCIHDFDNNHFGPSITFLFITCPRNLRLAKSFISFRRHSPPPPFSLLSMPAINDWSLSSFCAAGVSQTTLDLNVNAQVHGSDDLIIHVTVSKYRHA